jgi:hypothetical protein
MKGTLLFRSLFAQRNILKEDHILVKDRVDVRSGKTLSVKKA